MRALLHESQLAGQTAVVVGAGASGVDAARLLRALGADVRLLDRNREAVAPLLAKELTGLGVRLALGPHTPEQFAGADLVVPSPGVPVAKLADFLKACPAAQVVSELELAAWFTPEPIVAVTGTNGKTTTTTLIGEILKHSGRRVFVGGNIGTPLSRHVLSGEEVDVVVLEVSSFQLQNVHTFKPKVGVLLNFSANHLDYHADLAEYFEAKLKLFARMDSQDLAIAPFELKDLLLERGYTKARQVYFTASGRFPDNHLPGEHNKANMEAAWLACKAMGVTLEQGRLGRGRLQAPGAPYRAGGREGRRALCGRLQGHHGRSHARGHRKSGPAGAPAGRRRVQRWRSGRDRASFRGQGLPGGAFWGQPRDFRGSLGRQGAPVLGAHSGRRGDQALSRRPGRRRDSLVSGHGQF